mgnify:CR=1 FL=1
MMTRRLVPHQTNSGYISIKNLRRVAKELGETIDDSELQEMIERADTDNDGLVSEEEFYNIMTKKTFSGLDCPGHITRWTPTPLIIDTCRWRERAKVPKGTPSHSILIWMNELQRRVRYRDEEVNGSDYLIGMLLQQYEQGRYSE